MTYIIQIQALLSALPVSHILNKTFQSHLAEIYDILV